eukprot:GHVL01002279.1.p1 GENE.GHVL01002279.1~~GHVL01002279.1.p1  ORF type:complete len:346 (-),score=64.99 GHVL01002279.1:46-1083(-)
MLQDLDDFNKSYVFEKEIYEGSCAKLYICRYIKTNDTYIAKVVLKCQKDEINWLMKEASVLIYLDEQGGHKNIIKSHGLFQTENQIILLLDHLHGGDVLTTLDNKGHLSEDEARSLMQCILSALAYIHSKGLVHRDIKPDNIVFGLSNNYSSATLIDFGLTCSPSSATKTKSCNFNENLSSLTEKSFLTAKSLPSFYEAEESIVGTPGCISPEAIWQKRYTFTSDCFGAGVIMYMCLTGLHPFHGATTKEIFLKNKNALLNFDHLIFQRISFEAKDLIKCLCSRDPHDRLTADEALRHEWFDISNLKDIVTPLTESTFCVSPYNSSNAQDESFDMEIKFPEFSYT